jgi:hypothetical protein
MSPRLNAPLLSVDIAKMHKIDPRNVESLYGMWTGKWSKLRRQGKPTDSMLAAVFSKCADSIEGGKRYENLSWRLWNRETFCCPPQPKLAITPAIDVLPRPSAKDIPELSASVDSIASVDSDDSHKDDSPTTTPELQSSSELEDSALSRSRGHEKHLTPFALRKMVVNIQEQPELEPLSPTMTANLPTIPDIKPRPMSPAAQPSIRVEESQIGALQNSTESCDTISTNATTRQSDHRGSDTSVSSDGVGGLIRSGSVVHGFSPSQMSSSFRSRSKLSHVMPVPTMRQSPAKTEKPKRSAMFTLGGSSGDDESSFEDRVSYKSKRSSLSETLGRHLSHQKKPSFRDIVEAHQQEKIKEGSHESTDEDEAIASSDDEDDDDAIDSAIEEEDEGDWEDSNSDDGKTTVVDKTLFKRVDSRPNLVSRRSMLTTALHEPERAAALANAASRSSPAIRRTGRQTPQGPSLPASPSEHEDEVGLTMNLPGRSRPRPIIMTTSNTNPPAHSPRTTRRNMLSTELTESLRKNLLWERQQKNTTANAVFKRRHTAQNISNLRDYPASTERHEIRDVAQNNSWNHYFDTPNEYHNKGW